MPTYKYNVVDQYGKEITGMQDASDKSTLVAFLHDQNFTVVNIEEKINFFGELMAFGVSRVSLKSKVVFAKQLSTMLSAGLPITQALEIIIQQTDDKSLEKNLQLVLDDIQKSGRPLSDSMKQHTKIFNEVQINLVKAGETSGNLNEVLVKVADDLQKTKLLVSKIKGAMIYPAIVFIVIAVVMIVMVVYMIPAVQGLYADFGISELPGPTAFLVEINKFITNPLGAISTVVVVGSIIMGFNFYRSTTSGRLVTDKLTLKIPVFGNLIEKMQILQFCRLFSMLLRSGVPIIDSINIVASALNNVLFINSLRKAVDDISKGIPLAIPLSRSQVFPPLIVRMVAIGEETGKLDKVLEDMAVFYEEEVNEISENLNKLMEPMILVVVGGLVAFLAIAIYLPIYSIGNSLA
ncbi:type II secretion system F family protein [Candidatus Dojkabacteria bacterium]|nr:type II secretion system F family protein [Candidatus Dojkabacteria bacterium]